MNPEDRQRLKDAFKKYAENHPEPDVPALGFGLGGEIPMLSPNEWVRELENETEAAQTLLEMFAWGIKKDGIDNVVERLEGSSHRKKIVEALRKWVENHPLPDGILLDVGEKEISPRGMLQEVEEKTPLGQLFLGVLVDLAGQLGIDEVVGRFSSPPNPE